MHKNRIKPIHSPVMLVPGQNWQHRYDLRPRPPRLHVHSRVTGKRSGAYLDPPEASEPKRSRWLTNIPMEIGAIFINNVQNPWFILAVGVLLGIVYMSLVAVLLN